MNPELHQLLIQNDVLGEWEFPPDANWSNEISRVKQFTPELEEVLKESLRLDDGVQDASFFADLGVLAEQKNPNGTTHLCYLICIRFSWFGGMFSIYGKNTERYDTAKAVHVLNKHGYTYVPACELDAPHDGINKPYESNLTWWIRYFDYL